MIDTLVQLLQEDGFKDLTKAINEDMTSSSTKNRKDN